MAVDWFKEHAAGFSGQLSFDEPLSKHTYYRIGGPARVFAIPKTIADLQWLSQGIRTTGMPLFVLGAGSNLLVSDAGFEGLVVRATRINLEIGLADEPFSAQRIRTGGSVAISTLLRRSAQEGWGGLELLTGIPGSVGGAVMMNAGTHLGEVRDRLRRVEIFELRGSSSVPLVFEAADFKYEYRKNHYLPSGAVVLSAEWEVELQDPALVKARIDETLARRKATQPVDFPSCGSVFKNPRAQGLSAWQVVDRLGLRGHKIGAAQFAEKHSNFIINLGGAKAEDVRALIQLAKARALAELGVELEEEVIYLP